MLYHHHGIGKSLFICHLKHTGDHSYNYDHFFTAGACRFRCPGLPTVGLRLCFTHYLIHVGKRCDSHSKSKGYNNRCVVKHT